MKLFGGPPVLTSFVVGLLLGQGFQIGTGGSSASVVSASRNPFTDYRGEAPGKVHKIPPSDLPKPYATSAVENNPHIVSRPADAWPQAPAGFKVDLFAGELDNPRLIRTAPNGDLFLAESDPGRILVFRGLTSEGKPQKVETFA